MTQELHWKIVYGEHIWWRFEKMSISGQDWTQRSLARFWMAFEGAGCEEVGRQRVR